MAVNLLISELFAGINRCLEYSKQLFQWSDIIRQAAIVNIQHGVIQAV